MQKDRNTRQPLKIVRIPVTDPNGDEIEVYRREFSVRIPFARFKRKLVSYELDTGERVDLLDEKTFTLKRTNEKFFRVG